MMELTIVNFNRILMLMIKILDLLIKIYNLKNLIAAANNLELKVVVLIKFNKNNFNYEFIIFIII